MDALSSLFSRSGLRRLFNPGRDILEDRVRSLNVVAGRNHGHDCAKCGFGVMLPIPDGRPNAGMLRCDRTGCNILLERPAAA